MFNEKGQRPVAAATQRPTTSNGMEWRPTARGRGRTEGEREGAEEGKKAPFLPPSMRAPRRAEKTEKAEKAEEEKMSDLCVAEWGGWLAARLGANVVLCEAIFRQREVKRTKDAAPPCTHA